MSLYFKSLSDSTLGLRVSFEAACPPNQAHLVQTGKSWQHRRLCHLGFYDFHIRIIRVEQRVNERGFLCEHLGLRNEQSRRLSKMAEPT